MKLFDNQDDEESLYRFGQEAAQLLNDRDYPELASRFGYALAYEKEPAHAIREALSSSLLEAGNLATLSLSKEPAVVVKYFKPEHAPNFLALVECTLAVENGIGAVLAELIVSQVGAEKRLWLEQVSYCA